MLIGCARSAEPVVRTEIVRPEIPAAAREPCRRPSPLPASGPLTASRATSIIAADGAALLECEGKRAAAVAAVDMPLPQPRPPEAR